VGWSPIGVQSALRPLMGLLCQLRVIMMMEKLGETEVLGENLPQCRFAHHKAHMLPRRETGPPRWDPATNRLSYGTAYQSIYVSSRLTVSPSTNILMFPYGSLSIYQFILSIMHPAFQPPILFPFM
jgi:hypothetical protein